MRALVYVLVSERLWCLSEDERCRSHDEGAEEHVVLLFRRRVFFPENTKQMVALLGAVEDVRQ